MMFIAAALLITQPAPLPAEQQQEIEVIGQRLASWRMEMREVRGGAIQCRTARSSGDAEVDQLGCAAMAHCWHQLRPQLAAARRDMRGQRGTSSNHPVNRELGLCVRDRNDVLTAALAERRYQARHGGDDDRD